ncbi:MAG TPA: glycosyltransferase [Mycobacteriales bacterium]|nr:glycosyltransferase [Mycobacteriales bacterium]HWC34246.1 glycosyltransferase [Mycobacteriales bacterium]
MQESAAGTTVVVPTRDRPAQLATCLESVRSSVRPGDELVVVDSASRDAKAVAAVAAAAGAKLVRCELPGVNRARNAGWRAGSQPVVVFTDDDVVVTPGWRDALVAAVTADDSVGFVSGRILPPEGEVPSRDVAIKRGDAPERYDATSVGNLGHGASLAVPRSVLERIGGWDDSLGVGGRFGSSPEHDLFDRCFAAGFTGRFEPAAVAYHSQWRGPRRLLLLDARYGFGTGARLAKLVRTDRRRARLVAADYYRAGVAELSRELCARHGYPALGTVLRLLAVPVGLLRAIVVPLRDGHFRVRG